MKADLDIAIVIPSYDEGEDISSTLRSIIMSLDHVTESVKVGVFVVINNSQNSSEEVKKSNQKTLEYIQEGGFIKNPEGEGHRQYFRAAKDSSVFFEVINMFSNENAPNICNVGVACHQGFDYANQFLKDNGYFVRTDADAQLGKDYLPAVAQEVLNHTKDKKRPVLRGPVTADQIDLQEGESMRKIEEFEGKYIGICNEVLARNIFPQADPYWKEREKFHLPGANMAIPKEAYNQTSGFYAIPGAEDMMLGLDLVKAGFEIRQRIECLVRASNRISIRTQEGFGMGQRVKMLQSFEGDVFNFEGDQREFYQIRARLDEITDQIRNFPEAFESQVANLLQFHNIPVTGEQVAYWKIQWYEHCQAVPMLRFSEHPLIGLELQNLIRKKFPKINAWEHLNDSIIPFLKEYISDSLIEECENLMSLKPEESSVLLEHISSLALLAVAEQKAQEIINLEIKTDVFQKRWKTKKEEMFKQIHWLLDTKNRAPNKDSQEKELFSSRKANNLRNALSSGTFNDTDVVKNTFLEKKLGEFDEYISKIDIRLNIFHTSERLKLKG